MVLASRGASRHRGLVLRPRSRRQSLKSPRLSDSLRLLKRHRVQRLRGNSKSLPPPPLPRQWHQNHRQVPTHNFQQQPEDRMSTARSRRAPLVLRKWHRHGSTERARGRGRTVQEAEGAEPTENTLRLYHAWGRGNGPGARRQCCRRRLSPATRAGVRRSWLSGAKALGGKRRVTQTSRQDATSPTKLKMCGFG